MVDEVLRSNSRASLHAGPGVAAGYGSVPAPWGFAARYAPRDLADYWMEIIALSAGRTGVLLGSCAASREVDRLRTDARAALLATADPVRSLSGLAGSPWSAVCAVIDHDTIGYSAHGHPGGAITAPGALPTALESADGRLVVAPLKPGATVLLCSAPVGAAGTLLDDCARMHPDQLADRVILGLGGADSAAVLYRHPPEPLSITVRAEPTSLSVSRGSLREWLTATGVDSEICADVLLAAGEATANATEHAVVHATGQVDITLTAAVEGSALLLSVCDTGCWKPASVSGHRGHGTHLMNALMNSVTMTTGPEGTTVTMVKELPR